MPPEDEDRASILVEASRRIMGKTKKPDIRESTYRDAKFRLLFQRLDALDQQGAARGTSVTEYGPVPHAAFTTTPTNASTPSTVSAPSATAPGPVVPSYVIETLSEQASKRHERFWRQYDQSLPGLREHVRPARWRELSDMSTLEWLHHSLRHTGPVHAFSLNLSPDVEGLARQKGSAARWLSERISRRLKAAFGRSVDYWFALELTEKGHPRRLHIHGELQIGAVEAPLARKALRLAAGEWKRVRQHQCHTKESPDVVWSHYPLGLSIMTGIVPWGGRLTGNARPISGAWFVSTESVRSLAEQLYTRRRQQAISKQHEIDVATGTLLSVL